MTAPGRTLSEMLAQYERIIIIRTIQECGGSRTRAAASLGMRRGRLYERIHTLRIDLAVLPVKSGRPKTGGRR
jgi:DNA-binding NtrC family response regulator